MGLDKVAFKKGSTGSTFGDKCLRSFPNAVWNVADEKNFTTDQIWFCSPNGCIINTRSNIDYFFENPVGGDSILLELTPTASEIHANLYTCLEKHWEDDANEFRYQVSIYGNNRRDSTTTTFLANNCWSLTSVVLYFSPVFLDNHHNLHRTWSGINSLSTHLGGGSGVEEEED